MTRTTRVLPLIAATAALAAPAAADAAAARSRPIPRSVEVLLQYRERPALHAFARAVSDPASPRYRRYLPVEQIAARYGAGTRERKAVAAWARAAGLRAETGPSGTFAIVSGPAAAVRAAVGTGALAAAAGPRDAALPVPRALRGSVTGAALLEPRAARANVANAPTPAQATPENPFVLPPRETQEILTRYFGSARIRTGRPAGCEAGVNANSPIALNRERTELIELFGWTPNQYGTAYGFDKLHKRGLRGEKMRVALMETDGFKRSDVETFARCFGAKVPPISQTPIDMKRMPAPGDETTLDLSVLVGLAPRLGAIDIYASPSDEASLLKSAVAALRPGRAKPDVISISLGICEPLVGGNVVSVRAMSDVFAVAAGAGIGVFASSGDQGEAGCSSDDAPTFVPAVSLPAALPFVTAVGGTNLTLDGANSITDETVWNDTPLGGVTGGGGGLSIMIDRPWYQQPLGRTTSGPRGITRVVPDVSALADELPGYALFCTAEGCDNGWMTVGGTSAAAPLTAVGSLLMTQEARRHGQQPVGFVNPLLYSLATSRARSRILRDVVSGNNDVNVAVPRDAGGGEPIGQYHARRGYDPASGWGSLKLSAFSRAALKAAARR
jgi:kumamolisin